jgi:hypothetical protein
MLDVRIDLSEVSKGDPFASADLEGHLVAERRHKTKGIGGPLRKKSPVMGASAFVLGVFPCFCLLCQAMTDEKYDLLYLVSAQRCRNINGERLKRKPDTTKS